MPGKGSKVNVYNSKCEACRCLMSDHDPVTGSCPPYESWGKTILRSAATVLLIFVVIAVVLGFVGYRVLGNLETRNNPPASCQLFGGSWSWWSGWHCD